VFEKLIWNITWKNSDVVVHIDKRSDIDKFSVSEPTKVYFVPNRKRVHWSGWSLTETICETLEFGLGVSAADYFIYLAGTDFPLRHRDVITEFLSKRYPINFINWYPLVPGIWGYGLIDRYQFNDLKASVFGIRSHENADRLMFGRVLRGLVSRAEKKISQLQPRNTSWINFYAGSSRWCLNRETAQYVVEYYRSSKSQRLRNYLRSCSNSDEIFFQTTILNSRHKDQCSGFDERLAKAIFRNKRPPMQDEKRVYLHYIDWNPEREDPAIMIEADFRRLKESGKLFACKFVDAKSLAVIELIEREMLGANLA
jgi:hypothetical protein